MKTVALSVRVPERAADDLRREADQHKLSMSAYLWKLICLGHDAAEITEAANGVRRD